MRVIISPDGGRPDEQNQAPLASNSKLCRERPFQNGYLCGSSLKLESQPRSGPWR